MLVLTRRAGESLLLRDGRGETLAEITVLAHQKDRGGVEVKLSITAADDVLVLRNELMQPGDEGPASARARRAHAALDLVQGVPTPLLEAARDSQRRVIKSLFMPQQLTPEEEQRYDAQAGAFVRRERATAALLAGTDALDELALPESLRLLLESWREAHLMEELS